MQRERGRCGRRRRRRQRGWRRRRRRRRRRGALGRHAAPACLGARRAARGAGRVADGREEGLERPHACGRESPILPVLCAARGARRAARAQAPPRPPAPATRRKAHPSPFSTRAPLLSNSTRVGGGARGRERAVDAARGPAHADRGARGGQVARRAAASGAAVGQGRERRGHCAPAGRHDAVQGAAGRSAEGPVRAGAAHAPLPRALHDHLGHQVGLRARRLRRRGRRGRGL